MSTLRRSPIATLVAIELAVVLLAGCGGGTDEQWRLFKSTRCRFSAQFPGEVDEEDLDGLSQFQAVSKQGHFRITCSLASPPKNAESAHRELRAICDGTADSLHASVEETRKLEVHGHPALEFKLAFTAQGEEMVSHSRYVRCPKRFYQQIVTVPAGEKADPEVRRFFDSLELDGN